MQLGFSQNTTNGNTKPPLKITVNNDTLTCFTSEQTKDMVKTIYKEQYYKKELTIQLANVSLLEQENANLKSNNDIKDVQLNLDKQVIDSQKQTIQDQETQKRKLERINQNKNTEIDLHLNDIADKKKEIRSLKIKNTVWKLGAAALGAIIIYQNVSNIGK